MLSGIPRFVQEGYVIPGKHGWGAKDAKLKPDAPQWAKDEYEEWQKFKEQARKEMIEY